MRGALMKWMAGLAAATLIAGAGATQDLGRLVEVDRGAPVALVADSVSFDEPAGLLRASGDVEVYYGARTLTAREITYDSRADQLSALGPLTLRAEGGITLFADVAELSPDLREGLIRGAKALIADGAGQLAAVEARRVGGRYSGFEKAVYSSCSVCEASPTPLWRVRARRAIHDAETRMIHFEDAFFDLWGVPVAWLPWFRLPDPTVKRATGFLPPTVLSDSAYGYAAKIPFFIVIDDSSDATVTLFPTSRDGVIGELEYRRAFDHGRIELSGSLGDLRDDDGDGRVWRGHVFGEGVYRLSHLMPGEAEIGFRLGLASDKGYLRRYDFDNRDRLENELYFTRYDGRDFDEASVFYVKTLRESEAQGGVPVALPSFESRRVFDLPAGAGEIGFGLSGVHLRRGQGRDMTRLSLAVDWERRFFLSNGLALRAFASGRGDIYAVSGDPGGENGLRTRFAPQAGVEARYPLISVGEGLTQVIEPVVQFILAPDDVNPDDIPNEDSLIVEFDETNLFDANRFPGFDRIESGTRFNFGARYQLIAESGFRIDAAGGRSIRLSREGAFSKSTGLQDQRSDYVGALTLAFDPWLQLDSRLRLSNNFQINRADFGLRAEYGPARFGARYFFLESDATAGALTDRQELALSAEYQITRQWRVGATTRRDMENSRFVSWGARLSYANACAGVEAFIDRDYTSSEGAPASTRFGARLRLFGVAEGGARSTTCASRYALNP